MTTTSGNKSVLQDLSPGWARFCLDIQSFMEGLVRESITDKKLLLAFSGGPDSTALLRVLDFIRPRTRINICAVHLNHMLRPDADHEEAFVKNLCANLGIEAECGRINVSSLARVRNMGIEEAARTARYDFLQEQAARQGADYILTGHHLNDLAEDVLMRLGRGAGWPGLSGMAGFDLERMLVRPFLLTPGSKIMAFLRGIKQEYMVDKSNEDKSFVRNKVRLEVIPLLEEINPGFLRSVANLWKLGRVDQDHWESSLELTPKTRGRGGQYVSYDTLVPLSRATRLRLYKKILDDLGSGQALFDNLLELDRLWLRGTGNKIVQFPGNKFGRVENKGILFGTGG